MAIDWRKRVETNPDVRSGQPTIRGMRREPDPTGPGASRARVAGNLCRTPGRRRREGSGGPSSASGGRSRLQTFLLDWVADVIDEVQASEEPTVVLQRSTRRIRSCVRTS
ncbi:MAG: hypothetical protein ACP5VP_11875 [Candidatus Limnocylindrales bacterium]